MSVVEWFGRDYRHCQAQRTAEAQRNRSAPHVFSFCLILEQQTMRKHESPCQTIMGPKSTSYIVCRWCKSIKSYQAKKTRAIEKCWSQVAGIFPKGIWVSLFSFITQTKHILALRFADYSSCISLIFKNTSTVMHKHHHHTQNPVLRTLHAFSGEIAANGSWDHVLTHPHMQAFGALQRMQVFWQRLAPFKLFTVTPCKQSHFLLGPNMLKPPALRGVS